jgi:hypothetical protein
VKASGYQAYINSYVTDSFQVSAILKYPVESTKKLLKFEGLYVIAYGRFKPARDNPNKRFIELAHDFHMEMLSDSCGPGFFENCKFESYISSTQNTVAPANINVPHDPASVSATGRDHGNGCQRRLGALEEEVKRGVGIKRAELIFSAASVSIGHTEVVMAARIELSTLLQQYDLFCEQIETIMAKVKLLRYWPCRELERSLWLDFWPKLGM